MKRIYSTLMMLALMVAALSFTACGGDDDDIEEGDESSALIGTWEPISWEGVLDPIIGDEDEYPTYWWFKSDHTLKVYNCDSQSVVETINIEWYLNNGIITLKVLDGEYSGVTISFVIYKMEKSSMDWSYYGTSFHFRKVQESVVRKYLK